MTRKAVKIAIVVVVVIVGLFFAVVAFSGPYVNHDVDAITGIDDFVVLNQGSNYMARFSLVDDNFAPAAADVNVTFQGGGWIHNFTAPAYEFSTYKLKLTGQEFVAYAWNLDSDYDFSENHDASIRVTLPNGKTFEAEDTVY